MRIAEDKKDNLPCPTCGENWMYGWDNIIKLREFLTNKGIFRCCKCKEIFRYTNEILSKA